jgi:hypothetical protein
MNAKVKNILLWVGGILGVVLGFLVGRGRNTDRPRISDIKNSVDAGRRTVDGIRAGNQQIAESLDNAGRSVAGLEDGARQISDSLQRTAGSTSNAHRAVRDSLNILTEAEKRANGKNN